MLRSPVVARNLCNLVLLGLLAPAATPLLAGQTPNPHPLASPVPPVQHLADLVSSTKGSEIEKLLVARRWPEAKSAAQSLLANEAAAEDATPSNQAAAFALQALARAGMGDEAGALCRWHAAQALDGSFLEADLSAYGAPGQLLEDNPLLAEDERKDGPPHRLGGKVADGVPAVQKPELTSQHTPEYTVPARKARVMGVVVLEAVITKEGNVDHARVLKGLPLGLAAAAVDAVCDWRFKPATLEGKPIEVFYVLTVNFQLDKGPDAVQ